MDRRPRRHGFSLIEALVVLAISGMALAIIFSIGVNAGDAGFALGRRALSAADQDVAVSDLRSLFRSVLVRPARAFQDGVDRPMIGTPERFEADAVAERATQCAPIGWSGRLVLTIVRRGQERVLVCEAGARRTELLVSRAPGAALSYSRDGRTWTRSFTDAPPSDAGSRPLLSEVVYVRFQGGPGLDVVDRAVSGRPESWIRPLVEF
ncbi:type II secretion system protein [Brevundimonas sp. VNH65]|uniref:type II secretion system protein n=1 Tax=Brevundimonas sp. VNH65 TaxID=3400917 RepID=UPI003BFF2384